MSAQDIIEEFLLIHGEGPKQKSEQWHALKKTTIGGSEVATVLGMNKYGNIKSLIAQKINLNSFSGNTATRWGNLFELVTRQYSERIFFCEIYDGICSLPGKIERQRYSPDGIAAVSFDGNEYIVLFEFKAPFSTIPNGTIPEHYVPQVKTGLMSIDICNFAIFVNNCYRKCSLDDFDFSTKYDVEFHSSRTDWDAPIAIGIVCFSYESKDDVSAFDITEESPSFYEIDFGKENIYHLLRYHDEGKIKAHYYPFILDTAAVNDLEFFLQRDIDIGEYATGPLRDNCEPGEYKQQIITSFQELCQKRGRKNAGYLPWKLMISDVIKQKKDPKWKDTIETPIKNVLEKLDAIQQSEDPIVEYYNLFQKKYQLDKEFVNIGV